MSDINEEGAMELGPDIITLTSEDGEEFQFELLDRDEFEASEYVALVPIAGEEELPEDIEGELVFMRLIVDGEEEFLESLDDEDEYNRVADHFTERLSEFFDIE